MTDQSEQAAHTRQRRHVDANLEPESPAIAPRLEVLCGGHMYVACIWHSFYLILFLFIVLFN